MFQVFTIEVCSTILSGCSPCITDSVCDPRTGCSILRDFPLLAVVVSNRDNRIGYRKHSQETVSGSLRYMNDSLKRLCCVCVHVCMHACNTYLFAFCFSGGFI